MTQNASTRPIIAATVKSSTCLCCELECPPKIRDDLNLGHVHFLASITATTIGICCCTQRASNNLSRRIRAATVGSRPSPATSHESAGTARQGHRTPDQRTATGESLWSAARDQGKRPLHHDRAVDDVAQCELCVPVSVNESSVHHFDDELKWAPPQYVDAGTCIHCRTKHQQRSSTTASSPWPAADEPWRPPDSMANLGDPSAWPATSNTTGELGPTRTPNAHRAARTRQARPRTPPPPPQAPWTRHKQPASMGSSAEAVPTPSAEVVSHFFAYGEQCEKPLHQAHQSFRNTSWIVRRRG